MSIYSKSSKEMKRKVWSGAWFSKECTPCGEIYSELLNLGFISVFPEGAFFCDEKNRVRFQKNILKKEIIDGEECPLRLERNGARKQRYSCR